MNTKRYIAVIAVLVMSLAMSGCGSASSAVVSIGSFNKPVIVENGQIKVTLSELVNTGDHFGANGHISPEDANTHYFMQIKLSIENLTNNPVNISDFSLVATVNGENLKESGFCSIVCIHGSASIDAKKVLETSIYYLIPNNAQEFEFQLK